MIRCYNFCSQWIMRFQHKPLRKPGFCGRRLHWVSNLNLSSEVEKEPRHFPVAILGQKLNRIGLETLRRPSTWARLLFPLILPTLSLAGEWEYHQDPNQLTANLSFMIQVNVQHHKGLSCLWKGQILSEAMLCRVPRIRLTINGPEKEKKTNVTAEYVARIWDSV